MHVLCTHEVAVPAAATHAVSQLLQCASSAVRSWHVAPQQVWPDGHSLSAEQPGAHERPTGSQSVPARQSSSPRQATHAPLAGSQSLAGSWQSSFDVHRSGPASRADGAESTIEPSTSVPDSASLADDPHAAASIRPDDATAATTVRVRLRAAWLSSTRFFTHLTVPTLPRRGHPQVDRLLSSTDRNLSRQAGLSQRVGGSADCNSRIRGDPSTAHATGFRAEMAFGFLLASITNRTEIRPWRSGGRPSPRS